MKPINLREADFKKAVESFSGYDSRMLKEFFEYWSEYSEGGKKMRFEMEKTWNLSRRLSRWFRNQKQEFVKGGVAKPQTVPASALNAPADIRKADELLSKYRQHPTSVSFSEFCDHYDVLKREHLLKTFTKQEVDDLLQVYNGDRVKCRCAAVQQTFDGYAHTDLTFSKMLDLRKQLA